MNYFPDYFILNVTWIHRSPRKERSICNNLGCRWGRMTCVYPTEIVAELQPFLPRPLLVPKVELSDLLI